MRKIRLVSALAVSLATALMLSGCGLFKPGDCGDVLGRDVPRLKSSRQRTALADEKAVAHRFVPYARMAAAAYVPRQVCAPFASASEASRTAWKATEQRLSSDGLLDLREAAAAEWLPDCADPRTGFYVRAFEAPQFPNTVFLVFQGTDELHDWWYGNLHWFTRHFTGADQYVQARQITSELLTRFPGRRIISVGHSLGGGLAQHVLYSFPQQVDQAITFNPSNVTGYVEVAEAQSKIAACACLPGLSPESRIYRVYDSYEILALLRFPHKVFFSPDRHVQEVRFPNSHSHSIEALADYLDPLARAYVDDGRPWYRALSPADGTRECTEDFAREQLSACAAVVNSSSSDYCPQ